MHSGGLEAELCCFCLNCFIKYLEICFFFVFSGGSNMIHNRVFSVSTRWFKPWPFDLLVRAPTTLERVTARWWLSQAIFLCTPIHLWSKMVQAPFHVGIKLGGCLTLNHSTGAQGFQNRNVWRSFSKRLDYKSPLVIQNFPNTWWRESVWKEPLKAEPLEEMFGGSFTQILTMYLED